MQVHIRLIYDAGQDVFIHPSWKHISARWCVYMDKIYYRDKEGIVYYMDKIYYRDKEGNSA